MCGNKTREFVVENKREGMRRRRRNDLRFYLTPSNQPMTEWLGDFGREEEEKGWRSGILSGMVRLQTCYGVHIRAGADSHAHPPTRLLFYLFILLKYLVPFLYVFFHYNVESFHNYQDFHRS